ncbi:MAG: DNA (cytosine-5-)-methyltransferase [Muribaculaceae bacterium]|nr:DNA (cytosine-5-)-methyltransferase [Muribaculaceae bacterium]
MKVPFPNPSEYEFTFIDLFAGIGAFRLALQSVGGKCVFSSEWDKAAQQTYLLNYGEQPYGDITSPEVQAAIPNQFDVLCGGFPCQPFSICGKKLGFEDTRGTLFFEVCQILKKHQPQCCILENVQHITKHDKGRTFQVIISSLIDLGYNVSYKILNAKDFGLPQFRDRIFIVGTRNGIFDFNKIQKSPLVRLEDVISFNGDFEFLSSDEYTLLDDVYVKPQPKSGLVFCGYRNKGTWKKGVRPGTLHLSRCHRQPNRIYSIVGTHPTIPSQETSGRFFIYSPYEKKVRKLSVEECYKIMGFPDDFIRNPNLGSQYKQIGNSIAIPVISAIASALQEQNLIKPSMNYEISSNIRANSYQLEIDF